MWRLKALLRMNFPVAVFLNRLAAPRCDLSFGMIVSVLVTAAGLQSGGYAAQSRRQPACFYYCRGAPPPRLLAARFARGWLAATACSQRRLCYCGSCSGIGAATSRFGAGRFAPAFCDRIV